MGISDRDYYYNPKQFRGSSRHRAKPGSSLKTAAAALCIALIGIAAYKFWPAIVRSPAPLPHSAVTTVNAVVGAPSASITVIAPPGNRHYFVKLEVAEQRQVAVEMFIRGGEGLSSGIPQGRYRLIVASGHQWFGAESLFGTGTTVSEGDLLLDVAPRSSHTITLVTQSGGNIHMKPRAEY